MFVLGAALAAFGLVEAAHGIRAAASVSCPAPSETVRIAAVVDDLDLALEDGRTLKLAGLDPARATARNPDLGEEARRALDARLVGREVRAAILSPAPDRWERFVALVEGPADASPKSDSADSAPSLVNATLIAEGFARAKPDAASRPCFAAFLALERRARDAGLGLWKDPYYSILDADDGQGLAGRTGAMAVVEGRVRLHDARGRLYLDLGRTSHGLSAVLAMTGVKALSRAGLDPFSLAGSRIRVRGFLDDRFGPRIDISDPGQIERLDASDPERISGSSAASDGAAPAEIEPDGPPD